MTPKQLKNLRSDLGLSQDELAKIMRLGHRSQIHDLENERSLIQGPKRAILELLATAKAEGFVDKLLPILLRNSAKSP